MLEGYLINSATEAMRASRKRDLGCPYSKAVGAKKKRMHRSKDRPLQRRGGDEEFEGTGPDGEFDGKTGGGLAVNLSGDRVVVEGVANQRISFPEMNALCPAKSAHPERWQITQIAESALGR